MDIYYTENKISLRDFIALFDVEMKKLHYFESTIHNRISMIKRAFSGNSSLINEAEI
jgi:hypothetical protein